jgi:hypothetical protein
MDDRRGSAGLFDPSSREPRFILYILGLLGLIVILPFFNEYRLVIGLSLIVGGALIVYFAARAFGLRDRLSTVARLIVETGPVVGIGLILLAIVYLFDLRVGQ